MTTWMNLEGIMFGETAESERQILYDFPYMGNLNSK